MSEAPETASQPQETTPAQGANDFSSFLGGTVLEPDLSAEESSEPSAEGEGTEAEAEPELSGEEQVLEGEQPAESEEPAVEAEAATEEEAEQPPSVEERLKDILPRELESYSERYPTAWKMLQDPKTPEDLKHLLLDKIDSDHEIQRRIASEEQQTESEPTAEVAAAEPAAVLEPAKQREAYYASIDNLVKTGFDQQSLKEVGDTFLRMFNVNTKLMDDPNVSAEDKAVLGGLIQSVQKEAPTIARYMADTVSTVLPHVLPAAMEMIAPGWQQTYERQSYGRAWETVRATTDAAGKPLYPGLPGYPAVAGTPDAQKFGDMLEAAAAQITGFDSMVFTDPQGRVLPREQQAQMKYAMLARVASGQRVNPAVVAQAIATGKKMAGRADQQRQAGRALGAGQGSAKTLDNRIADAEEDPMMAALDREISAQETNVPVRGRSGGR